MKKTAIQARLCLNKKVIVALSTQQAQKVYAGGGTNVDTTFAGKTIINDTVHDKTIINTDPLQITGNN